MTRRRSPRRAARALREFLHTEAAGGAVVVVAVVAALVWANGPWHHSYHQVWTWKVPLGLDRLHLDWTLEEWVNDALMAVFFFVVGVEIKRELTTGHLRDRRAALVPAVAALGGMVVPALLFGLIADAQHRHGWGIPMATDIALAVGMVALLGDRVPRHHADDIGAIVVIAVFYGGSTRWAWLGLAIATVIAAAIGVRLRLRPAEIYALLAVFGWYALVRSGVHPTLMGVAFGLVAPVSALEIAPRCVTFRRYRLHRGVVRQCARLPRIRVARDRQTGGTAGIVSGGLGRSAGTRIGPSKGGCASGAERQLVRRRGPRTGEGRTLSRSRSCGSSRRADEVEHHPTAAVRWLTTIRALNPFENVRVTSA